MFCLKMPTFGGTVPAGNAGMSHFVTLETNPMYLWFAEKYNADIFFRRLACHSGCVCADSQSSD